MIYVVTNRNLLSESDPNARVTFGEEFNGKGASEVRIGHVVESDPEDPSVELITEPANPVELIRNPPSRRLFLHFLARMRSIPEPRNVVFYIHGYNTNFLNALRGALRIEELYEVDVVLFSWPSLGEGDDDDVSMVEAAAGRALYLRDKHRAEQSAVALERVFEKSLAYFNEFRRELCRIRFTLCCYSMGNFLLETLVRSGSFSDETSFFDNVFLVAADVNNPGHEEWVERLGNRRTVYVGINENDSALRLSELKWGRRQRVRLGNTFSNLVAKNALYLDFTNANDVGSSHGYFKDEAVGANRQRKEIFSAILNGERGERLLPDYDPNRRSYSVQS